MIRFSRLFSVNFRFFLPFLQETAKYDHQHLTVLLCGSAMSISPYYTTHYISSSMRVRPYAMNPLLLLKIKSETTN